MPGPERHLVAYPQVGEQQRLLRNEADPSLGRRHPDAACRLLEGAVAEAYVARCQRVQPGEHPQQRALAGAVGSEHGHHLAGADVERDVHVERAHGGDEVGVEPGGGSTHATAPVIQRSRSSARMVTLTTSSTRLSRMAASKSVLRTA